jgi:hypothetical protein
LKHRGIPAFIHSFKNDMGLCLLSSCETWL